MRKAILILLILFSIELQLGAQFFRSNQLGQILSEIESLEDSGYCVDFTEGGRNLYYNGELIAQYSEVYSGDLRLVLEKTSDSEHIKQYENEYLIRENLKKGEINTSIVYSYINGKLAFCTISDDQSSVVIFFLRSSVNREPVAIRRDGTVTIITDSMVYSNDLVLEMLASGSVIEGDYSINEQGEIQIVEGSVVYTYSLDGILLTEESPNSRTQYLYEDYMMKEKVTYLNGSYMVESYEEGKAISLSTYESDLLTSQIVYNENGNIQTLFQNGNAIATVRYKQDNRTVDSIEYY